MSALSILPKFLWIYIAFYLEPWQVIKMHLVHRSFDKIFDENYYRIRFIYHRKEKIAITQSISRISWKQSLLTYIGCNKIEDVYGLISSVLRRKTDRLIRAPINFAIPKAHIQFIVYMKGGLYGNKSDGHGFGDTYFNVEHNQPTLSPTYQMEIIGNEDADNPTVINFKRPDNRMNILVTKNFAISNIVFNDTTIVISNKSDNANCTISNCTFIMSNLIVNRINNYTINRCKFYYCKMRLYNYDMINPLYSSAIIMTGQVSDCIFRSTSKYLVDVHIKKSNFNDASVFTFAFNTMQHYGESSSSIINTRSMYFPLFRLTDNTVINVGKLSSEPISADRFWIQDNIFENCGSELTNQVYLYSHCSGCHIM